MFLPSQSVTPTNPILRPLKDAVLAHLREGQHSCALSTGVHSFPYTQNVSWSLWIGSILAENECEQEFLSQTIATTCVQSEIRT